MVRRHEVDHQRAPEPLARVRHGRAGTAGLLARRHQGAAVQGRPAVELDAGDLEPAGPQLPGKIDHLADAVEVPAMHHRVDGQRQVELAHPAGDLRLAGESAAVAADLVGRGGVRPLHRKLHVVQPGPGQRRQAIAREPDARGDQVRVDPGMRGRRRDLLEVAPRRRLAAREVELEHPQLARLAHHVDPLLGRELRLAAHQLQRVRTVGAGQRAAMGQLGQHRHRRLGARRRRCRLGFGHGPGFAHGRTSAMRRSIRAPRKRRASPAMRSGGAS